MANEQGRDFRLATKLIACWSNGNTAKLSSSARSSGLEVDYCAKMHTAQFFANGGENAEDELTKVVERGVQKMTTCR